jgi:GDP-D-mannose dehydratase
LNHDEHVVIDPKLYRTAEVGLSQGNSAKAKLG